MSEDISSRPKVDLTDPERSVPTEAEALRNPLEMGYLMMDLIARAEAAVKAGDHGTSVRYYRALAKAVPARAVSFSKLCRSYEALGERDQALSSCRAALGKGGVVLDDYARFVRLALRQSAPLNFAQIEEVDTVVSHVREELKGDPQGPLVAALLACEIAVRLEDTQRLTTCTAQLARTAPMDPRTFVFRWALALRQRDWAAGTALIESAEQAGIRDSALQAMVRQLAEERDKGSVWKSMVRRWGSRGGLGLALALALALLLVARRKEAVRAA